MKKHIGQFILSSVLLTTVLSANGENVMLKSPEELAKLKFDVTRYNPNLRGQPQVRENGLEVKEYKDKDGYRVETHSHQTPLNYYYTFYPSGKIEYAKPRFYDMTIGIGYIFDEEGNVINSQNFDEGYPLPLDTLITQLKKEHQVDLLDQSNVFFIERTIVNSSYLKKPLYNILYRLDDVTNFARGYVVDGETGAVLYTREGLVDDGGDLNDPIEEYEWELYQKERDERLKELAKAQEAARQQAQQKQPEIKAPSDLEKKQQNNEMRRQLRKDK